MGLDIKSLIMASASLTIIAAALFVSACSTDSGLADAEASMSEYAWSIAEPWLGQPDDAPTLFRVRQGETWGFIDKSGSIVIGYRWDEAGDFSEGVAPVRSGDYWGYVDTSGEIVIPLGYLDASSFSCGVARVEVPDGFGGWDVEYIDRTGAVTIPPDPRWSDSYRFSEGLAGVRVFDDDYRESEGFIDMSGKLVIWLPGVDGGGDFSEGLAAVRKGRYGYVDRGGKYVIEPRYEHASDFSGGLAIVEEETYEIIDTSGSVLVGGLTYDHTRGFSEGKAAVLGDEGWGYIDTSGRLVIACQFGIAMNFKGGLAPVVDMDGKMAYIDPDGNYVWREE